jgi:REP element-mobilizing transposase RayT
LDLGSIPSASTKIVRTACGSGRAILCGMWNDTDIPLAHLITFRCYGSWLHGDNRGSVDREHNQYKAAYARANENRSNHNRGLLKGPPVVLDASRRASVETAIRETCDHREWVLRAINVRTNHAYTVVSIGAKKSGLALNAFKANATRQMRQDGCWKENYSPWVDKGSTRNLWNERSVERAIDYVLNGQGDELPEFD